MGLKARFQKYGLAGLFIVTNQLAERCEEYKKEIAGLREDLNIAQIHGEKLAADERAISAMALVELRADFDARLKAERELVTNTLGQQVKLLDHFSGLAAEQAATDNPLTDEAINRFFQRQVADPLSQKIAEAMSEDDANVRARLEADEAAIAAELSDMAAFSMMPVLPSMLPTPIPQG